MGTTNIPKQLLCGHILHSECVEALLPNAVLQQGCVLPLPLIDCPKCSKLVPYPGDSLPLGDMVSTSEARSSTSSIITKFYFLPPKRQTFGTEHRVLYHMTDAGEEIKKSGEMLRGKTGLVGGGIYFADSPETCRAKAESQGYIIKAKVLVGKAKRVSFGASSKFLESLMNQYTFTSLQAEGYDSLHAVELRTGEEFIVYNKDQVELISVDLEDAMPDMS